MLQMHVSKGFWSYGVLTTAYLINHLPNRVLDFKSLFEVLQAIWHTLKCLDAPVLCTYHHHNVTSLIPEL